MSEIEDIAGMEFDELLLQQMHLGELDVVDWGVVSVPADDALSTSGMPWEVSRTVFLK